MKFIGDVVMFFLYYIVVGFFAVFYKILGLNPFKTGKGDSTYWCARETDRKFYRFTRKIENK